MQRAEDRRLRRGAELAHLVEEESSFVRDAEEPRLVGGGAGERAFADAEELCLDQVRRERAAVDRDEGPLPAGQIVHRARHDLFPGPRLTEDEHGQRRGRDAEEGVVTRAQRGHERRERGFEPGGVDVERRVLRQPHGRAKEEDGLADPKPVTVRERRAHFAAPVDEHPVLGGEILRDPNAGFAQEVRVVGRHVPVGQLDPNAGPRRRENAHRLTLRASTQDDLRGPLDLVPRRARERALPFEREDEESAGGERRAHTSDSIVGKRPQPHIALVA